MTYQNMYILGLNNIVYVFLKFTQMHIAAHEPLGIKMAFDF